MSRIRKNDQVIVITGKDKGRTGKVLQVLSVSGKVIVEGINIVRKHVKPNPQMDEPGGIKPMEKPIQASNIAIFNSSTGKADRIGVKSLEDGKKVRIFKSTNEPIDIV